MYKVTVLKLRKKKQLYIFYHNYSEKKKKLTAYNYQMYNILACLFYFIELRKGKEIYFLKTY